MRVNILIGIQAAQLVLLGLVAFYCVREWRNATRYRTDSLSVQTDRFLAEYVALKRRDGRSAVVAPVDRADDRQGEDQRREQIPVSVNGVGHAVRVPAGSDA